MSPSAAKGIRDWMESEHADARGPFTGASVGACDFIIMRSTDFEAKEEAPAQAEIDSVRRGMADFEQGRFVEAHKLSQRTRDRYGIHG